MQQDVNNTPDFEAFQKKIQEIFEQPLAVQAAQVAHLNLFFNTDVGKVVAKALNLYHISDLDNYLTATLRNKLCNEDLANAIARALLTISKKHASAILANRKVSDKQILLSAWNEYKATSPCQDEVYSILCVCNEKIAIELWNYLDGYDWHEKRGEDLELLIVEAPSKEVRMQAAKLWIKCCADVHYSPHSYKYLTENSKDQDIVAMIWDSLPKQDDEDI